MTLSLERQAFTVEPLSPVLGASIVGLDLREPLSEITKRARGYFDAARFPRALQRTCLRGTAPA